MSGQVTSLDRVVELLLEKGTVFLGRAVWCDTENVASVTAALAQTGKRVVDELRSGQLLTPKSPRGDAAAE